MKKAFLSLVVAVGLLSATSSAFADDNFDANSVSNDVYNQNIESDQISISSVPNSYMHTSAGMGMNFSSSWELSDARGSGQTYTNLVYGFNKYAIDEDYTHTYSEGTSHTAFLENANSPYSSAASAGHWAEVDVRHAGSNVTYAIL